METSAPFADVLEAIDRLSPDEQEALVAIVSRRMAERGRARVIDDVREARREFAEGRCRPASVDEIMGEILS